MRRGTALLTRQFRGSLVNGPFSSHTNPVGRLCWIGVDGPEVLPEQGFAQFELFFLGRKAPRRVMLGGICTGAPYARYVVFLGCWQSLNSIPFLFVWR